MGLNDDSFQKGSFDPNAFDFGSDRVVSAVTSQVTLTPKAAEIKFNRNLVCRTNRLKFDGIAAIRAKSLVFQCAAELFSLSAIKAVVSGAIFRPRPQRNIVPHKPTISIVINLGD